MQIEFSIPGTTADQLRARCDEENVTIEEFCAAAVLDKLFSGLYGDLNEKATMSQQTEDSKAESVVNETPTEDVQATKEETVPTISIQQTEATVTVTPKKKRVRELKSK